MISTISNECPNDTSEDCLNGPGTLTYDGDPVSRAKGDLWMEKELIYGFRTWHIMFLSAAAVMGIVILLCCCFKFRIPRTKQEIEGDYIRRKILRKFRRRLKTIQNQELDEMDLKKGVMEKLNLGPDKLMAANPRLIYARLSGYGQTGPYAFKAGHDINYVAMSGILSRLGRKDNVPTPPINLLADFAGGGLLCAFGILASLFERRTSGKGQVVDASMTEGAAYVSSMIFKSQDMFIWGKRRGENILDSGAPFYDTYETADGKYMAVGSLEPQFYGSLMEGLDLNIDQMTDFAESRPLIKEKFLSKPQAEWVGIFERLDACVTPVLELDEAPTHEQNAFRKSFLRNPHTESWDPAPAPRLSRTPGKADLVAPDPRVGQHTLEILKEYGYDSETLKSLLDSGTVEALDTLSSKL